MPLKRLRCWLLVCWPYVVLDTLRRVGRDRCHKPLSAVSKERQKKRAREGEGCRYSVGSSVEWMVVRAETGVIAVEVMKEDGGKRSVQVCEGRKRNRR